MQLEWEMWELINLIRPVNPSRVILSLKIGCNTKVKELSLPYYLHIDGRRVVGCISFTRVLALLEMLTGSSRFWTQVNVSISYDDNYYTMGYKYR